MKQTGSILKGRTRGVVLALGFAALAGTFVGCGGGGSGTSDRAMIDPGKADAERKAAEEAQRQNYNSANFKPKGAPKR